MIWETSYEQVLVEARRRHNTQAVLELEAIGSPPWAVARQEDVVSKWADAFEGGRTVVFGISVDGAVRVA